MTQARPLIGVGRIWHKRLRPMQHSFQYRSYFWLLPMRSLRAEPSSLVRRNRWGLMAFHDRDHGDGREDALAWLDELLLGAGVTDATGEVWLHSCPRVLGYVFNPVSFWYAHRADGSLAAVLVEVNNTFGQRHAYLLNGPELGWGQEMQASKVFHVSPFCAVEGRYRFRFSFSGDGPQARGRTLVRIDHDDATGPLLQTSVGGQLQPLTRSHKLRAFFSAPLMSFGVIARIHWQALRLVLKRLPFYRQPPAPERFLT
ncbi:DUF1365 domain-containing protein [Hydrogenophaga sp.]|uniref:DUF1365 domain-containing protein n=1 Tax=Hydrogenophaga sp. TaxID=1904254 RepID=UPI003563C42D